MVHLEVMNPRKISTTFHKIAMEIYGFLLTPPIAKGPILTQIRRLIWRDSHDGKEGVVLLDSHDVFCCTFSF